MMTQTSVALCTYNGSSYISGQMQSIINQTIEPNEIVVCDDGSTDNTIEIVESFARQYTNISWRIYKNKTTLRTVKNFEQALNLCSNDWIFLCDQDDIWKPNKVETMIKFVAKNPKTLLLFTNGTLIDENEKTTGENLWEKWGFNSETQQLWKKNKEAVGYLIHNRNYVTGATVLISKKLVKLASPFFVPPAMYHDCYLALFAAGYNGLKFIKDELILYRIHDNQQVGVSKKGKNINSVLESTNISNHEFVQKMNEKFRPKPSLLQKIISKLTT